VLAAVSSLAKGRINYLDITLTAAIAIGFTAFIASFGSRTARRVIPRVQSQLRLAEAEFALSMTLLFALSVVAVYAGVAAIVGAFLAGMALSDTSDVRVAQMTNGVAELLVPFFLVSIGIHLDLSAFAQGNTIALACVIVIAAVVSKFVGCGLGALRLGRVDAVRVGVGMVPRGEVGMVVAQIGLNLGVMKQSIYGIIVFMSVMTTLIAPPLLKLSFRGEATEPVTDETMTRLG
jgi:Kef-type K+ transport system membrane component KefB